MCGIVGYIGENEKKEFGKLWQARVENILLDTENWDKMITIKLSK